MEVITKLKEVNEKIRKEMRDLEPLVQQVNNLDKKLHAQSQFKDVASNCKDEGEKVISAHEWAIKKAESFSQNLLSQIDALKTTLGNAEREEEELRHKINVSSNADYENTKFKCVPQANIPQAKIVGSSFLTKLINDPAVDSLRKNSRQ